MKFDPHALNREIRTELESNHFDKAKLRSLIVAYASTQDRTELDVAMDALEYLRHDPFFRRPDGQAR